MKIPYIDIHTHHPVNSAEILSVPSLFLQDVDFENDLKTSFSAAIHPWHASEFSNEQVRAMLEKLTRQTGLIAIGETGLDKVYTADYERQKLLFDLHISFAENHHKPLIIHVVKSWNDLIVYLKKIRVPVVLHGFSEGSELTKQLIDLGCFFSIGKSVLQLSPRFREAIQIIPLTSIFLETDDSFLNITEIYRGASEILGLSLDEIKIQINNNFKNLFSDHAKESF